MKTIRIFLWIYCLATMATGETAPMTLGWDGTAPSYEVWRGIEKLAAVIEPKAELKLPVDALSTLIVIGIYPGGVRMASEPFVVQPLRVQVSRDLSEWDPRPWFFLPHSPELFLRADFIR
jgi:hypothetical protein